MQTSLSHGGRWLGSRGPVPFLEHRMGVDAAKPECVDAGPPWLGAAVDPGPGLGVDVERRALQAERRVGPLAAERRRQHAVVQREGRLDQARDAGRRDRVADHRLDRPQRAPRQLAFALPEHARQRLHLDDVADGRSGAVRLHQPDAVGGDARGGIGVSQRQHLALHARSHHAHPAPVAGDADAADHRIHAVAVADGVPCALEHDRADALSQQGSVGSLVEGAQLLAAREGAESAEQVHRRDRHPHLRTAGQREVAMAGEQVAHRVLDGHQRGGARGVDGVCGTHQVEPVRDPADDDVRDEPGHGLRPERRQRLLQLAAQPLELILGAPGFQLAQEIERLADDEPALDRDGVAAVQVGPLA